MLTIRAFCADRKTKDIVRKAVGMGYGAVVGLKESGYEPRGWDCDCVA